MTTFNILHIGGSSSNRFIRVTGSLCSLKMISPLLRVNRRLEGQADGGVQSGDSK